MRSRLAIVVSVVGVVLLRGAPGQAQPPAGGGRVPSASERYGESDTRSWYRDALAWDAAPVDLRFLNRGDRPAGRRGSVRAVGDRLVFDDGTPARFWGANLAANALFSTPRQQIASQARRMAQLGYNLMRIHHHDSQWVQPNVFDSRANDTRHLSRSSLETLDWWIKCLEDEGISIWLDLRVGRVLRPGDRVSLGRDEIERAGGGLQGFDYTNPDLQKLMIEFQHAYLSHVNRYTNRAYKDDPAVIAVLVSNEDDYTGHFGVLALPDKNNPVHNQIFTREYQAFARAHSLPAARVFRTWEPGPSKLFLNEVEHQFNRRMVTDLRELGVKALIATTSYWGDNWLTSLPALTDSDVIDVHSYGKSEAFRTNPRSEANYIHWIGAGQVHGRPLTITEWNVQYPSSDRFTAPLYVASLAALQGWDASMIYNYAQVELNRPNQVDVWSTFVDPALTGMMPAAALAFRQGHIRPARSSYCLKLDPAAFFDRVVSPNTSATIRTLIEQSRLTIGMPATPQLPWLKPSEPKDAILVTDPDRDFIPQGQSWVRSDTGELARDWELGIQTVDSPRTQAVSGWIGGKTLQTRDATFRFVTKKAVVALSSIDDQPLSSSRFVLITAMARALSSPNGRLPMLSEPVVGTIALRTTTDGLDLLALGRDGRVVGRMTPTRSAGALTIAIPTGRGTHWFVLKASEPAKDQQPAEAGPGD
ncbi:MAG TPA: hypothetical protein VFF52_01975 [Isosphaeraceae bacterium]|nr:hypothetical protein [Isosphaeraceae bacterium]